MDDNEGQTVGSEQIRSLIEGFVSAIRAKDVDRVMSIFSPDVISYDLNPPLQHGGGDIFREHWQALFSAYGAIEYEIRDLHIAASDDLAFTHSLNRTSGTLKSGQHSERWLRWTACFRKYESKWLIVHEHVSIPADLKTGRAVLDLKP
jgi:uncharacterized protein (TIGR02246 family)